MGVPLHLVTEPQTEQDREQHRREGEQPAEQVGLQKYTNNFNLMDLELFQHESA